MSYTKTNAITTGQPANVSEVNENFEDVRRYVNQTIDPSDIDDNSITHSEIVRGELTTFAGVNHQFTTGNGYGTFIDGSAGSRWTGHTNTWKREILKEWTDQSNGAPAPGGQTVLSNLLTVSDSYKSVVLDRRSIVTYRCFIDVHIDESPIPAINNPATTPKHRWSTFLYLTRDNESTWGNTTKGRMFDETEHISAGPVISSWAGEPAQDPMRNQALNNGHKVNIERQFYRRQYVIYKTIALDAGTYDFGVMIDAHNEKIYLKSQNVTVEVEAISNTL